MVAVQCIHSKKVFALTCNRHSFAALLYRMCKFSINTGIFNVSYFLTYGLKVQPTTEKSGDSNDNKSSHYWPSVVLLDLEVRDRSNPSLDG